MLVREILNKIEEIAPLFLQENYDNSGIQIDGPNIEASKILVSLDPTPQAIRIAVEEGCQLVLTHHPLLFEGVKRLTPKNAIGDMIYTAIMGGITVYAYHTNYDSAPSGLNDALARRLKMSNVSPLIPNEMMAGAGIGRVGNVESMEIRGFAHFVKEALKAETIQLAPTGPSEIRRVAICSGSGADFIEAALKAKADVYITGDVTYHKIIEAVNSGLSLIIVGHDESEKFFEDEMKKYLESFGVKVIKYHEKFYHNL